MAHDNWDRDWFVELSKRHAPDVCCVEPSNGAVLDLALVTPFLDSDIFVAWLSESRQLSLLQTLQSVPTGIAG